MANPLRPHGFYTQTLLHTKTFAHRRFYILHTNTFTHRRPYTPTHSHTDALTHQRFDTQTLLHTQAATQAWNNVSTRLVWWYPIVASFCFLIEYLGVWGGLYCKKFFFRLFSIFLLFPHVFHFSQFLDFAFHFFKMLFLVSFFSQIQLFIVPNN